MRRYALRDDQWERIRDLLPGREGHVGVTAGDGAGGQACYRRFAGSFATTRDVGRAEAPRTAELGHCSILLLGRLNLDRLIVKKLKNPFVDLGGVLVCL